jgi:hypothetical protein
MPVGGALFTDQRIHAALAMSPSLPRNARDPQTTFAAVAIPWMLMTGTLDVAPIGDADVATRLGVFPALLRATNTKLSSMAPSTQHSAIGRFQATTSSAIRTTTV